MHWSMDRCAQSDSLKSKLEKKPLVAPEGVPKALL